MRIVSKILASCFCFLPLLGCGQTPSITCQISTVKSLYKIGETPAIAIQIKNSTDTTIQMVKVLDGSEAKWRYPHLYYEVFQIIGNKKRALKPNLHTRCGNMDGIGVNDFVEVRSGQGFDPLANQSEVYTRSISLFQWSFKKKGKYSIVFHYSTAEVELKKWMGDTNTLWFGMNNEVFSDKTEAYNHLISLFNRVPKVDLTSNELLVEFN